MGFWTVVFIVIGLMIVHIIYKNQKNAEKKTDAIKKFGIKSTSLIDTGRYTCGHPGLNSPIDKTNIVVKDGLFEIYAIGTDTAPSYVSKIPIPGIKNITMEDASTMEKRVTLGRMLAVGIFAFAWKKKEITEISYLIIEWNDGKFDHSTIFEFTNVGAVQCCNQTRNKLINSIPSN